MWQLASFSVEVLNTSHTGANVLGQKTKDTWETRTGHGLHSHSFVLVFFPLLENCQYSPKLRKVASWLGKFGHGPGISLFNSAPRAEQKKPTTDTQIICWINKKYLKITVQVLKFIVSIANSAKITILPLKTLVLYDNVCLKYLQLGYGSNRASHWTTEDPCQKYPHRTCNINVWPHALCVGK